MRKIKIMLFLMCMAMLLVGCTNSKKDNNFTQKFIPALEESDLNFKVKYVEDNELHLIGANFDSFKQCIDLLKEVGYEFYPGNLDKSEEDMINMQLWQGEAEEYTLSVWLMLDMTDSTGASDFIKIYYNPVE